MALAFKNAQKLSSTSRHTRAAVRPRLVHLAVVRSHKVEIEFEGKTVDLEVPDGKTILEVALDKGIDLPHDCKLGVCMTCPAKVVAGEIDQSGSMLSDDVAEKGYALMCMAVPQSDVKIKVVSEEELLDEQLVAGEYA